MMTFEKNVAATNDNENEWGYWVVQFTYVRPGVEDNDEIMENIICASSRQEAIDKFIANGHPLFKLGKRMRTGYMIEDIYRMPERQRIALGYEL